MNNNDNNVTSMDKPRCSMCGQFKLIEQLNGYNPLAQLGKNISMRIVER